MLLALNGKLDITEKRFGIGLAIGSPENIYNLKAKGTSTFLCTLTKVFLAWRKEVIRVVHLKKLARHESLEKRDYVKQEQVSSKSRNRGRMRRTINFMTRIRYLRPAHAKWNSQARKVKDALEFRSAQAIQKIFRKILAQTLAEQMRAKLKYLFDIRVQREKDILSLTALNANMEMQKYQMLLVHFLRHGQKL